MTTLPGPLTVDEHTISVRFGTPDSFHGNASYGHYEKGKVVVSKGQTLHDMRDTLLHEVLHWAVDVSGVKVSKMDEETFISAVSPWVLEALRQNPDLVEFVTGV